MSADLASRVTVREVYSACAASSHRAFQVLLDGAVISERLTPISPADALQMMVQLCENAANDAFNNGCTHNTGKDEGE